ncbi:hypothetical protein HHK36_024552 [Tetracentron sinense]|uniref:Uncharacterized protein n=1 Tax=Tetracentron sinense TaxID=13715 RepID=A0A835D4R3_TETSI|nr:hypothetical protein HHK36_024552 [Tetracentron sinense]
MSSRVFAARKDSYDRNYDGKLVDENMIVLRKRIHEMKMIEPPSDWMEWEKQYYANYDSDICEAMGLLQSLLMKTRPSLALGMVALITLSVPASIVMVLFNFMEIAKDLGRIGLNEMFGREGRLGLTRDWIWLEVELVWSGSKMDQLSPKSCQLEQEVLINAGRDEPEDYIKQRNRKGGGAARTRRQGTRQQYCWLDRSWTATGEKMTEAESGGAAVRSEISPKDGMLMGSTGGGGRSSNRVELAMGAAGEVTQRTTENCRRRGDGLKWWSSDFAGC